MQYNTTIYKEIHPFFTNKIGGISAFRQKYPLYFQEYSNNS